MFAFITFILCFLQFVQADHEITSFKAVQPATVGEVHFDFNFTDPRQNLSITTPCGAIWDANASYPTQTFGCANSTVRWHFLNYQNISSFTIETARSWREYQQGGYAAMSAVAKASFGPSNFTCSAGGNETECVLPANHTLILPIYTQSSGWVPTEMMWVAETQEFATPFRA